MIDENKKGVKAFKRKIKPRNPYAAAAHKKPAGPMKDKKAAAKRGHTKHKKSYAEQLEHDLHNAIRENRDMLSWDQTGSRTMPSETHNGGGEYNDEVGMVKSNLQTIVNHSVDLAKILKNGENLPEWVQEKIATAKGMLVAAVDYMESQHQQGEIYTNEDVKGEEVTVLYINGKASIKYTDPSDAKKDAEILRRKHPDRRVELKREIRGPREGIEEGWGKAIIGTIALIAALAGINHMHAEELMHSDPQLAKLAQFRERAIRLGDQEKVHELDDRIKTTLDHLEVTDSEVMGDDGKPIDPVYEWTHDSLAAKLFEQELTYEDQLNGMLRRKLR